MVTAREGRPEELGPGPVGLQSGRQELGVGWGGARHSRQSRHGARQARTSQTQAGTGGAARRGAAGRPNTRAHTSTASVSHDSLGCGLGLGSHGHRGTHVPVSVARPLHSVLRKNYGFSPLVYTDAPHCEGSFQGGFQVDQREVSARERGGPWAGGALGSRSGWITGASQEWWPHCRGPHLAEHASTSRTPGHDTRPKARGAPSLTAKPKAGHMGVTSAGREPQGLGQAPPMPGKLGVIREGWAGSRAGGCKGASEKQGGHRRAGSEADSTIRQWPGRRAEDEDLDQRQPASHTLTGRETEQALNLSAPPPL